MTNFQLLPQFSDFRERPHSVGQSSGQLLLMSRGPCWADKIKAILLKLWAFSLPFVLFINFKLDPNSNLTKTLKSPAFKDRWTSASWVTFCFEQDLFLCVLCCVWCFSSLMKVSLHLYILLATAQISLALTS